MTDLAAAPAVAVATLFVLAACGSETTAPATRGSRPAAGTVLEPADRDPGGRRAGADPRPSPRSWTPGRPSSAWARSPSPTRPSAAARRWRAGTGPSTGAPTGQSGGTRWGTYVVTGTCDGTTFTASDAIPGAS